MEGTLLDAEILDVAAELRRLGPSVHTLTRKAMEGKVNLTLALRERVQLLAGIPLKELEELAATLPLMPKAEELVNLLKAQGHHVMIITGSFEETTALVAKRLGIEMWVAHKLDLNDGKLTGTLTKSYPDKSVVLAEYAKRLKPDFTVAVGDGSNDIGMLEGADIGIAFQPKDVLKGRPLLYATHFGQLIDLFGAKKQVAIDKSVHPFAARLFAAVGTATVIDLNVQQPADADIIIIRSRTHANSAFFKKCTKLEILATATSGTDHIDKKVAQAHNILIVDAAGENADSVADYVLRMLLYATDDVAYTSSLLKTTNDFEGIKAANKRQELGSFSLGIVGLGAIGKRVQQRSQAFGMLIKAFDPNNPDAKHSLEDVLGCDVVTLHVPLLQTTKGMIGHKEFASMKEGAIFINVARGELVDEQALKEALQSGKLKLAILDVFCDEPHPSPLYELPNTWCTPHIAGNSEEAKMRAVRRLFLTISEQFMNVGKYK